MSALRLAHLLPVGPSHDDAPSSELCARHVRPGLAAKFKAVRLDVTFHRARGNWLYH